MHISNSKCKNSLIQLQQYNLMILFFYLFKIHTTDIDLNLFV